MSEYPPAPLSDDQWAAVRIEGRWAPATIAAAEWASQRLSDAVVEQNAIRREVSDYVAEVRAWAEDRLRTGRAAELARDIEFFEAALRTYALELRRNSVDAKGEPRVKTIKLPSATLETVKAKDRKPKFTVSDNDAVIEWAREGAPDALVTTVDLRKIKLLVIEDGDGIEAICTADGEFVPGVTFTWDEEPREPAVHIRLNKAIGRGES